MRTGFSKLVYGDGGKVFPVAQVDRLNAQLDPKPDAAAVYNPMDFDVVFRVNYSGDGTTFGSNTDTTVKPNAMAVVLLNGGGPTAKITCATAAAHLFYSFIDYAKGNGLA